MALGIYISVPFCRTKCSYCNFASDVFSQALFERYVDRVCADIENSRKTAAEMGGELEHEVDSIYLGGGTPTVLASAQLERIFTTVRRQFDVSADAEVTVECAPGTLTSAMVETLLRCGVNRVSLGVQSFVDREAAAVGRLHKRTTVLEDIARLRSAGISKINLDLIAGLPHQTAESWNYSLSEAIATGAPHASVYMLEVDEDSRLGRELLAGGTRYHAHFVPDEGATADFYLTACDRLQTAAIKQYEISNFAREGCESVHNLKYWTTAALSRLRSRRALDARLQHAGDKCGAVRARGFSGAVCEWRGSTTDRRFASGSLRRKLFPRTSAESWCEPEGNSDEVWRSRSQKRAC